MQGWQTAYLGQREIPRELSQEAGDRSPERSALSNAGESRERCSAKGSSR